MKVAACRREGPLGLMDLVFDTDDVEDFETPRDVHELPPQPGDESVRRELGQAHLILHFREGTWPRWEKVGDAGGGAP